MGERRQAQAVVRVWPRGPLFVGRSAWYRRSARRVEFGPRSLREFRARRSRGERPYACVGQTSRHPGARSVHEPGCRCH